MDFGLPKRSQNRAKIHSKSTSQKTCDFSSNFARKMLYCNSADIDFVLVFPILFACRALFFESLFECILGKKTYQKPFQNDVWTLKKSMPKTCCFSTSFFSGFGIDFGGSWASKMEPSWLKIAIFLMGDWLFLPSEVEGLEKSRLGALRTRFWSLRASILEALGLDFGRFVEFWDRLFGKKVARKCFLPAGSD